MNLDQQQKIHPRHYKISKVALADFQGSIDT